LQQRSTLRQTNWRSDTLPTDVEVCLNSKLSCDQSNDQSNQGHLSPRHLPVGEPLTQLPLVDNTNVNATDVLGVKHTNNCGDKSQPTTSRVHNSQSWQSTSSKLQSDDLNWFGEYNAAFFQPPSVLIQRYRAGGMATPRWSPDTKGSL
jgi:hypothetical protein